MQIFGLRYPHWERAYGLEGGSQRGYRGLQGGGVRLLVLQPVATEPALARERLKDPFRLNVEAFEKSGQGKDGECVASSRGVLHTPKEREIVAVGIEVSTCGRRCPLQNHGGIKDEEVWQYRGGIRDVYKSRWH